MAFACFVEIRRAIKLHATVGFGLGPSLIPRVMIGVNLRAGDVLDDTGETTTATENGAKVDGVFETSGDFFPTVFVANHSAFIQFFHNNNSLSELL
jgi:hypothetical protein